MSCDLFPMLTARRLFYDLFGRVVKIERSGELNSKETDRETRYVPVPERMDMGNKRPKQAPEGMKEAADPTPEVEPDITEDPKGGPSPRLDSSEELAGSEEKRRVREKLKERERDS